MTFSGLAGAAGFAVGCLTVGFVDSAGAAGGHCGAATARLPIIPHPLQTLAGVLVGLTTIVVIATVLVRSTTMLRRQIRHFRISARSEGLGARTHPNQNLVTETPAHPLLDLIIGRWPPRVGHRQTRGDRATTTRTKGRS
jgi:hypothetical protein